jgi:hypothetical protein
VAFTRSSTTFDNFLRCGMDLLFLMMIFCAMGVLALHYSQGSHGRVRSADNRVPRCGPASGGAALRSACSPPPSQRVRVEQAHPTLRFAPRTNQRAWRIAILLHRGRRRRLASRSSPSIPRYAMPQNDYGDRGTQASSWAATLAVRSGNGRAQSFPGTRSRI